MGKSTCCANMSWVWSPESTVERESQLPKLSSGLYTSTMTCTNHNHTCKLNNFLKVFFFLPYLHMYTCVHICVRGCTQAMICMWKAEDNLEYCFTTTHTRLAGSRVSQGSSVSSFRFMGLQSHATVASFHSSGYWRFKLRSSHFSSKNFIHWAISPATRSLFQ